VKIDVQHLMNFIIFREAMQMMQASLHHFVLVNYQCK